MTGLAIHKTITVSLTAKQWELYTASMDCREAANALNLTLQEAVNANLSRREVESRMEVIMREYADYGTDDSEPMWKLELILDRVFARE